MNTVLHKERIPEHGVLVVPGRLDFAGLLEWERLFRDRRVTWLVEESSQYDPALRSHLERSGSGAAFSCDDGDPAAAGRELAAFLADGGVLFYVPGRAAVRNATPCHVPSSHLRVLCAFGLPVLPVVTEKPRESALSIERKSSLPDAVHAVGRMLPAGNASVAGYLESLLDAASDAFAQRDLFKGSLAGALLNGLRANGGRSMLIDGSDDSELPFHKILAAALAFSRVIREETDRPRVAIVLPPGKAGLVANLAVMFAGKVPVNLNFTSGPEAVRSCIRQSGVDRFITADPFVRKVSSFPWPPNRDLILIERVLPALRKRMVFWAIASRVLPQQLLASWLGLDKRKGDDEAALLFTSGSSGEPKGVVLTHRNLLANVVQFGSRLDLPAGSSILGCLPLFHSFGCTVTLWYPVLEGVNLVTYPSPLESKRLAELIALHQVDVLLATPTFLRGYMKRVEPAQLSSLKLVVTGAEKLPQTLADSFEARFGIRPQEGYGLTETAPATNVNLPDPAAERDACVLSSSRSGSVGQMLPGVAVRVTDPENGAPLPLDNPGIIWLKGPNVFPGYLDDPKRSAEVLKDGWFRTGDVGHLDADGFLHIGGRISRFSKVGGEMVPHESVEGVINKVLGLDGETERRIAVVGVPDEQKGEAIILLSTLGETSPEQECLSLRYKLLDAGLPSLWCPKRIIRVDAIPVLASGKLDIRGCQALAERC
jgi:acyl-[acyl-carrier-protein]-phospholipid O-acyltransferase/long-chain-fatty-acid--[acyl-carrier-protein] ligase